MNPLFNIDDINKFKATELLPLKCINCTNIFYQPKNEILKVLKNNKKGYTHDYCSKKCKGLYLTNSVINHLKCTNCEQHIIKKNCELNQSKNPFCSRSCAATYNNLHKTTGTRRSKLEQWLQTKLITIYPDLQIMYCDKTTINAELDIYIPSLKLAFELNGIYHYEPIHGQSKLDQIQSNDHRKFQACLEHEIELVIIDASSLKYFKEQNCLKYLDIIQNILNIKLNLAS